MDVSAMEVSEEAVADFISTCPACQKYRLGMSDSLQAPVRGLSIEHRHTCGYDTLDGTPEDTDTVVSNISMC